MSAFITKKQTWIGKSTPYRQELRESFKVVDVVSRKYHKLTVHVRDGKERFHGD